MLRGFATRIRTAADLTFVLQVINAYNTSMNGLTDVHSLSSMKAHRMSIHGYIELNNECYMIIISSSNASLFSKKNPNRWFKKFLHSGITWSILQNIEAWLEYDTYIWKEVAQMTYEYKPPTAVVEFIDKQRSAVLS